MPPHAHENQHGQVNWYVDSINVWRWWFRPFVFPEPNRVSRRHLANVFFRPLHLITYTPNCFESECPFSMWNHLTQYPGKSVLSGEGLSARHAPHVHGLNENRVTHQHRLFVQMMHALSAVLTTCLNRCVCGPRSLLATAGFLRFEYEGWPLASSLGYDNRGPADSNLFLVRPATDSFPHAVPKFPSKTWLTATVPTSRLQPSEATTTVCPDRARSLNDILCRAGPCLSSRKIPARVQPPRNGCRIRCFFTVNDCILLQLSTCFLEVDREVGRPHGKWIGK